MYSCLENYPPRAPLPSFRTHRRNSSDPNFFLNNNPQKIRGNGKLIHTTPPSNTSDYKFSSPLIHAVTHKSPPKHLSFQLQRRGQPTNLARRNLWPTKEKCLMQPQELLHQYQFLSLGCCYLIESRPQIREVLTSCLHNSEAVNYKLSYMREPA